MSSSTVLLRPRRRSLVPDRTVRADCRCRNPFGELPGTPDPVVLDTRALPAGGRIGRTLAALEALPAGAQLLHLNALVPWELFARLESRGFTYRLLDDAPEAVRVLVWRRAPEPKEEP